MNVLISAYACEPGKGSEPAVGWNGVCQAARFHKVCVITRHNNRPALEAALKAEPLQKVQVVSYDLPRWLSVWKRGQRGVRLYYYLWQIGVYLLARRLMANSRFDVVQHATFVNCWTPSLLALLPVPFFWGPVGGGEQLPRSFWPLLSWRGRWQESLRCLAQRVSEWDPLLRLTARRAALTFATTPQTESVARSLGSRYVTVLSQVALPQHEIQTLARIPLRPEGPFRVLSLGRLLGWKGFELGLEAFARLQNVASDSEYWIVGDGPERCRLERRARQLGVAHKVRFWGALCREDVFARLAECDVLLHPSLHDSGGWVCAEAMGAGRPVVCLNWGGPALTVTGPTGFAVNAHSPAQAIAGMAEALQELQSDPQMRLRMGMAARQRIREHFSTDCLGDALWGYVDRHLAQAGASGC